MNRPKFEPIFTQKSDYCERSSQTPIESFVPHQAISLTELISRFERGQRLNVHMNFRAGDNLENISDEEAFARIHSEDMDSDDFPPTDVHDVVDVQRELELNDIHKREFKARQEEKKKQAQQAAKQAQQAKQDELPPDPPVA